MSEIVLRVTAPEGAQFHSDAFAGVIGHGAGMVGHPGAWLRRTQVVDNGTAVELIVETTPAGGNPGFGTFR